MFDLFKKRVIKRFSSAGIKIHQPGNGLPDVLPGDVKVIDPRFYRAVALRRSLGLGEAYMFGWWDCQCLDSFLESVIWAKLHSQSGFITWLLSLNSRLANRQSRGRSFQVGQKHYDQGNDLFAAMLDKRLVYSCAVWGGGINDLDAAQEKKLDLICRKLRLRPGKKLLDIGCGFGSLLKFAHERYGVSGVGVTVSKNQAQLARKLCAGLPIEIRLADYRELNQKFDAVASVGMFEHVGYKNYPDFFKAVNRCLPDGGLFFLHTIAQHNFKTHCDPWFDQYIFPNGMLPCLEQLEPAFRGLFLLEHLHNIGPDYYKTLMAWRKNYMAARPNLREIKDQQGRQAYDAVFERMWHYYLSSVAMAFKLETIQVWQMVFAKGRFRETYWPNC